MCGLLRCKQNSNNNILVQTLFSIVVSQPYENSDNILCTDELYVLTSIQEILFRVIQEIVRNSKYWRKSY